MTMKQTMTQPASAGSFSVGRCLRKALGFVDPTEKRRLSKASGEELVSHILKGEAVGEPFQEIRTLKSQSAAAGNVGLYRTWRLRQMLESPHPFREMMTLFWLDLFAISALRVKDLACYHAFCEGLEERALAPWGEVLGYVLEQPAFLANLRAERNYRAMPNRQLGEFIVTHLMARDPTHAQDWVNTVARSFTGLFVRGGELRRYDYEHDTAVKVIGQASGDFWPKDVAGILAQDTNTATVLAGRLYRWFIASDGDVPSDYLETVTKRILAGDAIGEVAAEVIVTWTDRGGIPARRVKTPFEVFLALARPFQGRATTVLADLVAELGWDVLHPTTYTGWPKGRDWMNTAQLARRMSLAEILLRKEDRFGGGIDVLAAAKAAGYDDDWPGFLLDALLDDEIPQDVRGAWERHVQRGPNEAILFLVALPEFQFS